MPTYYFTGPGGWAYSVVGTSVTAIWSPRTRREINVALNAATSAAALREVLFYYPGRDAAIAAAKAAAGGGSGSSGSSGSGSSGSTTYPMSAGGGSTPTGTSTAPPAPAGTKITDQPWFMPAVVGGLGLLAILAFTGGSSKRAKPAASAPASPRFIL